MQKVSFSSHPKTKLGSLRAPGTRGTALVSLLEKAFPLSLCTQLAGVSIVVQFYPWLNFYFPLFYIYYHTLSYTKTKENRN